MKENQETFLSEITIIKAMSSIEVNYWLDAMGNQVLFIIKNHSYFYEDP